MVHSSFAYSAFIYRGNIYSLRSFTGLPVVETNLSVYPQAKYGSDIHNMGFPHCHVSELRFEWEGIAFLEDERGFIFHASSFLGGFTKKRKTLAVFCLFTIFFKEHQSYHFLLSHHNPANPNVCLPVLSC